MSTQEIIRELTKLDRDELAQVDLKLHELLEEKIRTSGRSWGEALLEVAGTTDCISFVVMNERDINDALTNDHHFEQAGFRILLKD
jgi:predicted nucleic acid-binding protein